MPGPGGRGPGGPRGGAGGMFGHNWTMRDANSAYDMQKTLGNPRPVSGLAGTGYVSSSDDFSFINLKHRISLAWKLSYHSNGASRIRSFFGNYQVLSHDATKRSRLEQISVKLSKRYKEGEIDAQTFGNRIMYEAESYYGWLYRKTYISEEKYRECMLEFAEKHGIDYSFGDEEPTMSR